MRSLYGGIMDELIPRNSTRRRFLEVAAPPPPPLTKAGAARILFLFFYKKTSKGYHIAACRAIDKRRLVRQGRGSPG